MVSFRELNLPAVLDTSRNDLTQDFFAPLLSDAVRYDRGVGFFSSGWLRINAQGRAAFARNGVAPAQAVAERLDLPEVISKA